MNHLLLSLAAAGLLVSILTACSQAPTLTTEIPKEPAKATISEEAQKALVQAKTDVTTARSMFALWTTAETALLHAQEAAKAGDSAAVIKQAAYASEQVKGGLAQLTYPSTEKQ
jgi:hypothetical protein